MRAALYCRLSRDDLRVGQTLENHVGILLHLAERHGIPASREDVVSEIESSDRIDTREGLLRVLELCRTRAVTHLLVFDVARMTRGMEDNWAAIKRALFRGNVTLVTPRGTWLFDNRLDTAMLDIEAVFARRYRWEYSVKRQEHNLEKARRGRRYCGSPVYGYRTLKPPTDIHGNALAPTEEDVARGLAVHRDGALRWRSHVTHPEEYPVLCEIVRRIRYQGMRSIMRWLNAQGHLPPSMSRGHQRRFKTSQWNDRTVKLILTNPFLAGFLSHRYEVARERGQVSLPREQWVLSDEEGDWEHPLTLDEWREIQELVSLRRPREGTDGPVTLLTGILRCPQGRPMSACGDRYTCHCPNEGGRHRGRVVRAWRYDAWAKELVERALAVFDPALLPEPRSAESRAALLAELRQAERLLGEKERALDDLMRRASFFLSLPDFGTARYESNLSALSAEGERLRARMGELRAQLAEPDPGAAKPLLQDVQARRDRLWQEMEGWGLPQMRQLIRLVVKEMRVELEVTDGYFVHGVSAELWPWFGDVPRPELLGPRRRNGWARADEG